MERVNYNKSGTIFNIQKFSVNDGPGIRTTVFLKGCPLHCKWCSNPESQSALIQMLWDQKKCINCQHCVQICPVGALSYVDDKLHFNPKKCTNCRSCVAGCPNKSLELEGEQKTVKEIIDIVLQDKDFYEESNGGLTLSGGEILAQPDFTNQLVLAAKENGLHTCCETTGFANPDIFHRVIQYIDYILFDVKHWNSQVHRDGTGVSNELPLQNLKYAIEIGKEVLPRIPIIPSFNDSLEDASAFASSLHNVGATRCQLLPFHQFGENKYHLLNQTYEYEDIPSLHKEDLSDYIKVFHDYGIDAFF